MQEKKKVYEVTRRVTGERAFIPADSAQEACEAMGWRIGDCYVKEKIKDDQNVQKRN